MLERTPFAAAPFMWRRLRMSMDWCDTDNLDVREHDERRLGLRRRNTIVDLRERLRLSGSFCDLRSTSDGRFRDIGERAGRGDTADPERSSSGCE